jgi:glycosyltransferase involved in cell wall biosynthesis
MKKSLVYVTNVSFLDTDLQIVNELNKRYLLIFVVLIPFVNVNLKEEEIKQFCLSNSINLKIYRFTYRASDPRNILKIFSLLSYVKKKNANVNYFTTSNIIYFNLLLPFYINRKRLILAIHDVVNHFGVSKSRDIIDSFRNTLFINFHFFSNSQAQVFKKKFPKKKYFIAPLALKDFGPLPVVEKDNTKTNLLFFGSIRDNKGLEYLLNAVKLIDKESAKFKVTIVGNSKNFAKYSALIEDKDLFDLNIRWISNDEIPLFFANADFLVLPYKDITQSGPLLISYNYNVPVIASKLPGFEEYIIHGKTGFLFTPLDSKDLAEKLEFAINLKENERLIIRNNLRQYVMNNISLSKIVEKYAIYFDKMCNVKI